MAASRAHEVPGDGIQVGNVLMTMEYADALERRVAAHAVEQETLVRSVPLVLFGNEAAGSVLQPAVLTLRIQPHEGISSSSARAPPSRAC